MSARRLTAALLLSASVAAAPTPARSEPIARLDRIQPAILACSRPERDLRGPFEGYAVTLRFSLARAGALLGAPRITYASLPGDDARDRAFVASVLAALDRCLPLPITDGLGAAIAGRPFTVLFTLARRA